MLGWYLTINTSKPLLLIFNRVSKQRTFISHASTGDQFSIAICFSVLVLSKMISLRLSLKIHKIYKCISLVVGLICIAIGAIRSEVYLALLGGYISINAIGTLRHIYTGKHDKDSSLPKDIKIK